MPKAPETLTKRFKRAGLLSWLETIWTISTSCFAKQTLSSTWEATCQDHPEIRSIRYCSTQNDLVLCTLEFVDSLSSEKRLMPWDGGIAISSRSILLRPWSLSPFIYCASLRHYVSQYVLGRLSIQLFSVLSSCFVSLLTHNEIKK